MTAPPTTAGIPHSAARRGGAWLLAAVTMSSLGDGAFTGAVPVAAAALTRNPAAVAAVSAAAALPWLLVTPVAGALVDRWPYRPVMLAADLARGTGLALLTVLVVAGHASIPALAVASCLVVCGQIFHDTAVQGCVPLLAGRTGAPQCASTEHIPAETQRYRVRAVVRTELLEQTGGVLSDRFLRQEQALANFGITTAATHPFENLDFPGGEHRPYCFRKTRGTENSDAVSNGYCRGPIPGPQLLHHSTHMRLHRVL